MITLSTFACTFDGIGCSMGSAFKPAFVASFDPSTKCAAMVSRCSPTFEAASFHFVFVNPPRGVDFPALQLRVVASSEVDAIDAARDRTPHCAPNAETSLFSKSPCVKIACSAPVVEEWHVRYGTSPAGTFLAERFDTETEAIAWLATHPLHGGHVTRWR